MRNYKRGLTAMAVAAVLATATNSVLLFGYAIAVLSCTAVVVVGTRRLVNWLGRRQADHTATTPLSHRLRPEHYDGDAARAA